MALMPIGNLPLIQAEKTGEDTQLLSSAIAITTVVSIITITILMTFFTAML
jgi:predicted permease